MRPVRSGDDGGEERTLAGHRQARQTRSCLRDRSGRSLTRCQSTKPARSFSPPSPSPASRSSASRSAATCNACSPAARIDALEGGLLVLAEEFADWADSVRRIDLLCLDSEAQLVVVELKGDEDGGHMV